MQTFDYSDCNLLDWYELLNKNTGQNSLEDQNVRFCADVKFGIQNSERGCKDDRFWKAKKEI